MLEIKKLYASYETIDGDVNVLRNLNFVIKDNEIFGIAGESGSGKTTFLKTIYDIIEFPLKIDGGKVVLSGENDGKDFKYESGEIRASWWKNISYIPQAAQSVLNPIVKIKHHFFDSIPKKDRNKNTEEELVVKIKKHLEDLSLSGDLLEAFPFQLSGGMRQRVIIALSTFMSPNIMLADEPTTALDVVVQRGILMMLMRLQKELKNTIVLVSHDMGVHYQVTNRMGIMYSGSIVELGKTDDVFNAPVHPYTKMLVGSLPRFGDKSPRVGIKGRPPSLVDPPPGCRFAPRCPDAMKICSEKEPEFLEIKPGHFISCHLTSQEVK